jgi:hypothetical protein
MIPRRINLSQKEIYWDERNQQGIDLEGADDTASCGRAKQKAIHFGGFPGYSSGKFNVMGNVPPSHMV